MADKKQAYDDAWLLIEKIESVERSMKDFLKYVSKTRKSIEETLRESESGETRGL